MHRVSLKSTFKMMILQLITMGGLVEWELCGLLSIHCLFGAGTAREIALIFVSIGKGRSVCG